MQLRRFEAPVGGNPGTAPGGSAVSASPPGTRKLYFPNLNGIRFLAAFLVIIHHQEQLKFAYRLPNLWSNAFVQVTGKLGVILFFVLSGFLITYLLLEEERSSGTISVRRFYVRRMLRIWPLYYLVVILALFILPHVRALAMPSLTEKVYENFGPKLTLFVLMLPNLAVVLYPAVPFLAQAWSIGTEEQFYILWPLLMKYIRRRRVFLLWSVLGAYLLVKAAVVGAKMVFGTSDVLNVFHGFLKAFNIDCMAIGGLLAYAKFNECQRVVRLLTSRPVEIGAIVLCAAMMGAGVKIPYLTYEMYAVLFGVIILNAATNSRTVIRLENPVMDYMGRVSYGLYMYHPLAIGLSLKVLLAFGVSQPMVIFASVLLVTVVLASVSYELFERKFLKLKKRFSTIESGDSVREGARSTAVSEMVTRARGVGN